MKPRTKKPLYRKVNTKTHGVSHMHGSDYKHTRRTTTAIGMRKGIQRGLDYTPLFKFLLSKVGNAWPEVHSEAVGRLDKEDPIYWMVAKQRDDADALVRLGESSYYSGLYIDQNNVLQVVDSTISEETLDPLCACCTHTFNGVRFTKPFDKGGV